MSNIDLGLVLPAFFAGVVFTVIFLAVFIPDGWSKWLVERKNLPIWSVPIAVIGLIIFVVLFTGAAVKIDISNVAEWVFWILYAVLFLGLIILFSFLITRFKNRSSSSNQKKSNVVEAHVVENQVANDDIL